MNTGSGRELGRSFSGMSEETRFVVMIFEFTGFTESAESHLIEVMGELACRASASFIHHIIT
jgi:hypothetical protein